MNLSLQLMLLFCVKHFIVDFMMQTPYMYKNKGKLGHPGGVLHAGLHGAVTFGILWLGMPLGWWSVTLSLWEAVTHYFIDYSKININAHYGWGPTTSEYYWWMLGADQFLHSLCYIFIAIVVTR